MKRDEKGRGGRAGGWRGTDTTRTADQGWGGSALLLGELLAKQPGRLGGLRRTLGFRDALLDEKVRGLLLGHDATSTITR